MNSRNKRKPLDRLVVLAAYVIVAYLAFCWVVVAVDRWQYPAKQYWKFTCAGGRHYSYWHSERDLQHEADVCRMTDWRHKR